MDLPFPVIVTSWTWPTIPWWLVAAGLFGLVMIAAAIVLTVRGVRRYEPRPAIVAWVLVALSFGVGAAGWFLATPPPSLVEVAKVTVFGTVTSVQPGEDGTTMLTVDKDPTWNLVVTAGDVPMVLEKGAPVALTCDYPDGPPTLQCTAPVNPENYVPAEAPVWATVENRFELLPPADRWVDPADKETTS